MKQKRHRRTKAELLQDPVYRKKHGLDRAKKAEKPKEPTPKKRHRRTKAELLQDPVYRKKHSFKGVVNISNKSLTQLEEAITPKKHTRKPKGDRVYELEMKYLPKLYLAWEKVQHLMNELEKDLNLKQPPAELAAFDNACCAMETAFNRLEENIKNRSKET